MENRQLDGCLEVEKRIRYRKNARVVVVDTPRARRRKESRMSIDNLVNIAQQVLAIIVSITALSLVNRWLATSKEQEEPRKVTLDLARQVRRSAFQRTVAMLRVDEPVDPRGLNQLGKLEEQSGIE